MAPASLGAPTTTANWVALKCTNHWRGCAAWNGLDVARLFAISSPAATPLITTITSIAPTAAAIIAWSQTTEATGLTLRRLTWANARMRSTHTTLIAPALLRCHRVAAKQCVNGARNIFMHEDVIAINDLHDHIKRWWRLAFQNALLRAASSRLVITERHRLNAAD